MNQTMTQTARTAHQLRARSLKGSKLINTTSYETARPYSERDTAAKSSEQSATAELMSAYQSNLVSRGRSSLASIAHYLKVYRQWLAAYDLTLSEVDGVRAEDFQTELATRVDPDGEAHYARKTVKMIVWAAKGFHEWLREAGQLPRNPFRDVPKMKLPKRIPRDVPDAKELAERLGALARFWDTPYVRDRRTRYRLHVMAEMLYATGMRLDELGALTPDDIDLVAKTVKIRDGKGGVARLAYLTDYAVQVLDIYLSRIRETVSHRVGNSTLFGAQDGQCLGGILNHHLKAFVGMTSHGFRHALGTHLLRAGCDLRLIQLILGHEDLKSTAIYTKVVKEDLRDQLDRYHPRNQAGEP